MEEVTDVYGLLKWSCDQKRKIDSNFEVLLPEQAPGVNSERHQARLFDRNQEIWQTEGVAQAASSHPQRLRGVSRAKQLTSSQNRRIKANGAVKNSESVDGEFNYILEF